MSGVRSQLRLLFLTPFPPRLDGTHGGTRVIAQLLLELARRHHVALAYLRSPNELSADGLLQERCDVIEEVSRMDPEFSLASRWNRFSSVMRGIPIWATSLRVAEFESRVRSLVACWKPDLIQIEYHVMGQYLSALAGCGAPLVLTEHEPGARAARDLWASRRGVERLAGFLDILAWNRFERRILRQVQRVVVFTERDRQALARFEQTTPIVKIPLGATLPEKPLNPVGSLPPSLLFVGNFAHQPNIDAALRLAEAIFPQVQSRHNAAELYIVGDQPTDRLRRLANERVVVTGRVPDVTPYLDRASVVVTPLRQGGGMRVKVLEAIAAGKALVASALAVEGIDIKDGEHFILAETDRQFCDVISDLLDDPKRREAIAVRARAWALANLGWEQAVAAYEELYSSLIETPMETLVEGVRPGIDAA